MKLIKFVDIFGCDCYINVDKILYVTGNDRTTYIHIDGDMISVKGSLLLVTTQLTG